MLKQAKQDTILDVNTLNVIVNYNLGKLPPNIQIFDLWYSPLLGFRIIAYLSHYKNHSELDKANASCHRPC